jgi:hypothetical protein
MAGLVLFSRRFQLGLMLGAVLLLPSTPARAQGIGFQGGVTVDPEQYFFGTHFESGDIYRGLKFKPSIDGGFGQGFTLATVNLEFLFHIPLGRSGWSLYQGGGPAIVMIRVGDPVDDLSVHAGSVLTFGFAHRDGFFSDFKFGGGDSPQLKFVAGYTIRKKNP